MAVPKTWYSILASLERMTVDTCKAAVSVNKPCRKTSITRNPNNKQSFFLILPPLPSRYLLPGATQYQFFCHGDDRTLIELELRPLSQPGVFTKVCSTDQHTNHKFTSPIQFYQKDRVCTDANWMVPNDENNGGGSPDCQIGQFVSFPVASETYGGGVAAAPGAGAGRGHIGGGYRMRAYYYEGGGGDFATYGVRIKNAWDDMEAVRQEEGPAFDEEALLGERARFYKTNGFYEMQKMTLSVNQRRETHRIVLKYSYAHSTVAGGEVTNLKYKIRVKSNYLVATTATIPVA